MKTLLRSLSLAAVLGTMALPSFAQDDAPFTDGTVYRIATVRTNANSQNAYLKQLDQYWYPMMVKAKALGLIKDFHLLTGMAANKEDYDVMTIIEVNSLADLDPGPEREAKWKQLRDSMNTTAGGKEKMDAFRASLNGTREILGEKIMREQLRK